MPTYKVKVGGKEYEATVVDTAAGARVTVAGQTFEVESVGRNAAAPAAAASVVADATVPAPQPAPGASAPAATLPAGSGAVCAPIPGIITKICVTRGQRVEVGDVVVKLEAMKMENDIAAPMAGTIKELAVSAGTEVKDGQLLATIE